MLIDFYGFTGPWPYWNAPHTDPESLLKLLDRHKIDAAAICNTVSIFDDWRAGNQQVMDIAQHYPKRLLPFVCVNPVLPPDVVAKDLADYKKRGARGVRLYPQHHRYSLTATSAAANMLSTIQDLELPVVLPSRLIMNWGLPVLDSAAIDAVVQKYPKIQFILSGTNYGEELWLIDLLNRTENVSIEFSGAQGFRSVNYIVSAAGYRKVLFGTGAPLMYPACGLAKLRVLRLPPDQMAAIESGNARRLLKWNP
jgi:predicted TIM-barrel fold metal-dependent hydrolase